MKISQRVSKLFGGQHFHCEIFKGHYSVKNVGRVMVLFFFFLLFLLVFCTSFDDALYLYKVRENI